MITVQQNIGSDLWFNVFAPIRTHYLVEFINFVTEETKVCVCENIDVLTLSFTEQDVDDALNGKLSLRPSGRYLLNVYLQPLGSEATNLDTGAADEIQSVRIQVEQYKDN